MTRVIVTTNVDHSTTMDEYPIQQEKKTTRRTISRIFVTLNVSPMARGNETDNRGTRFSTNGLNCLGLPSSLSITKVLSHQGCVDSSGKPSMSLTWWSKHASSNASQSSKRGKVWRLRGATLVLTVTNNT